MWKLTFGCLKNDDLIFHPQVDNDEVVAAAVVAGVDVGGNAAAVLVVVVAEFVGLFARQPNQIEFV